MSTLTAKERLTKIFESGEIDAISRTNRLKAQSQKIEEQEARIKELESLTAQKVIKKSNKQKKVLTDDEKQALKDRLALGRKKKALENQESSAEPNLDVVKPTTKPKSKMTSEDIDIDDLLDKMNLRLKQKAAEKQAELKAEKEKQEKEKQQTAKHEPEPESAMTAKYNKFLRNISKPKYY